ncbi:hypothetical protein hmeg3_20990 [Herbaspirillum sp. meg3]|jgi:FMN-dependent NADH-azoreductase|uniref:DUF4148 domain-containing protein n=1 Tax=Herbaspirillum rhizosphaerae TaxID=346179 RepID=A0ABW8ZFQ6_9BURK|nr:DUF4148 domain-containing protein [Herbaspirillum sp. meg3]ASU40532.1 hypothetical protein hmeg3_20990 [Herbaspirillum sp. meg3]
MNIKKIATGLLFLSVIGSAMAEEAYPPETQIASHKTRAQVIEELKQARANGEIISNDLYPVEVQHKSTVTRQAVKEELKQVDRSKSLDIGA